MTSEEVELMREELCRRLDRGEMRGSDYIGYMGAVTKLWREGFKRDRALERAIVDARRKEGSLVGR